MTETIDTRAQDSAGEVQSSRRLATVLARDEIVPGITELTLQPPQPAYSVPPGSHIDVTLPLPSGTETRS
ncbi:MAG TPA: hypothetical protein VHC18_16540 [Amycolatopsis sp.]|nr:hypothetical protein [Amycolatopsis sp.]